MLFFSPSLKLQNSFYIQKSIPHFALVTFFSLFKVIIIVIIIEIDRIYPCTWCSFLFFFVDIIFWMLMFQLYPLPLMESDLLALNTFDFHPFSDLRN